MGLGNMCLGAPKYCFTTQDYNEACGREYGDDTYYKKDSCVLTWKSEREKHMKICEKKISIDYYPQITYRCSKCSFSSDKRSSLNFHFEMFHGEKLSRYSRTNFYYSCFCKKWIGGCKCGKYSYSSGTIKKVDCVEIFKRKKDCQKHIEEKHVSPR